MVKVTPVDGDKFRFVVEIDGKPHKFTSLDKTRPIADKNYQCESEHHGSKPHIKKGDKYVRITYDLDGKFGQSRECLDCAVIEP